MNRPCEEGWRREAARLDMAQPFAEFGPTRFWLFLRGMRAPRWRFAPRDCGIDATELDAVDRGRPDRGRTGGSARYMTMPLEIAEIPLKMRSSIARREAKTPARARARRGQDESRGVRRVPTCSLRLSSRRRR